MLIQNYVPLGIVKSQIISAPGSTRGVLGAYALSFELQWRDLYNAVQKRKEGQCRPEAEAKFLVLSKNVPFFPPAIQ